MAGTDVMPWVEKYRPQALGDLVSHTEILSSISRLIESDRLPHLMFYGPPGTGKTTTALAIARRLYGNDLRSHVLELNASDDRTISFVRDQIKDFASTRVIAFGNRPPFKLIILDEADAMTRDAQAALRRTIEKYATNTRFALLCNYSSKISPAIQSRCTKFRFQPLQREAVIPRLQFIAKTEGVEHTQDGIEALARIGSGDMRKSVNLMQAANATAQQGNGLVDEATVYTAAGLPLPEEVNAVVEAMLNTDFVPAYQKVRTLQHQGIAITDLLRDIHELVLRILTIPPKVRCKLLSRLADVEYSLSLGAAESIQLGAIIGSFQEARAEMAELATA